MTEKTLPKDCHTEETGGGVPRGKVLGGEKRLGVENRDGVVKDRKRLKLHQSRPQIGRWWGV